MKKKCRVVMLPTNQEAPIYKVPNRDILFLSNDIDNTKYTHHYHLYILSDDEIKEGDWFIANQGVHQCLEIVKGDYPYKIANQYNNEEIQYQSKYWSGNKIIATTNSSLNLPRPSNEFIQKFCEKSGIWEVMVEYILSGKEYVDDQDAYGYDDYKLKVAPDNTISIYPIKESWNREEVIELCKKACQLGSYEDLL